MKLHGEVSKLETTGNGVLVTLANVVAKTDGMASPYREPVSFELRTHEAKTLGIGRKVEVAIRFK